MTEADKILGWREGAPFSPQFDDVYFQKEGLAESRHVFLAGNDLPARFEGRSHFTIAELGFGTGLNFLATWDLWRRHTRKPVLHYIGIELYPLTANDMARAHQPFGDIQDIAPLLHKSWPENKNRDFHQLMADNLSLTILFGAAEQRMNDMPAEIDAWYLDGFAPAKNPGLWTSALFHAMASKSAPGAGFATFTVARAVRDAASSAGFMLEKRRGFGRKRDMLTGLYHG